MPTQPELIAIGISRVSLLKQVTNYSLEHQNQKFAALEKKFNCRIPQELMIEDGGFSGTDFGRPSLREALRRIHEGAANAIAFPYLDRFSRHLEAGLATIRKFREAGAQVLLGDYGWVTDERQFKIQMQLGLMIAEWQRDDIQEKSRGGVEAKIRRGLAHGGRSPFGWRFVTGLELAAKAMSEGRPVDAKPQNVHEPVISDQATVRLMGDLALDRHSLRSICRELDARCIPSPDGLPRWNATTAGKILRAPCNSTGIWHYGKHELVAPKKMRKPHAERHQVKVSKRLRPENQWIPQPLPGGPIWSPEKHAAIIEAVERNGKVGTGKPAAPEAEGGYEALLKKLVKCKHCGYAMAPKSKSTPAGRRLWYVCTHRDRVSGEHLCALGKKHIKADLLEGGVWDGLRDGLTVSLDRLVREHYEQIVTEVNTAEAADMRTREVWLTGKLAEAASKEIMEDDAGVKQTYSKMVADLKGQLKLLRRRIDSFAAEAEAIEVDCPTIMREVKTAMRTKDRADQRRIVVAWVHQIDFGWVDGRGEAEITLRVPLTGSGQGANCQQGEPHVDNKHPLAPDYIYLKTKVRVA